MRLAPAFRLVIALSAPAALLLPQMLMMGEASEGFVALYNGRDLAAWDGDESVWKIGRGALTGLSDKKAVLLHRTLSTKTFDLRFDARGPGSERSGAEPSRVLLWASRDGARVRGAGLMLPIGDTWREVRILARKNTVIVYLDGKEASDMIVDPLDGQMPAGSIAFELPGGASTLELRNIRIRKLD